MRVVAPGYEPLAALFDTLIAARERGGAALCVYSAGVPVCDIWAGPTFGPRTSVVLFSVTKAISACCAALLIQDGALDPEAPVARYWPEFADAGKEHVTVADLLAHRAGLPVPEGAHTVEQWIDGTVAAALASQEPVWPAGAAHGYHTLTYGVLAQELVRRVTGRTLGEILAERIARPLALDLWLGLPDDADVHRAPLLLPPPAPPDPNSPYGPDSLAIRSSPEPFDLDEDPRLFDRPGMCAFEMPAVNAVGTAHAIARMLAACVSDVDGVRLLSPETVATVAALHSSGTDRVVLRDTCFGLGFALPRADMPMAGPGCFGHDGMGGALCFADPRRQLAFSFVTDLVPVEGGADPDTLPLVAAMLRCADLAKL